MKTGRTEDPGVWIGQTQTQTRSEVGGDGLDVQEKGESEQFQATTRKVCAIGVQVSRGVATHGIGLNVSDKLGYLSWGFERIVACGLEGKTVTWLGREGAGDLSVDEVAGVFAREVASGLKVDGVRMVTREEVEAEEVST